MSQGGGAVKTKGGKPAGRANELEGVESVTKKREGKKSKAKKAKTKVKKKKEKQMKVSKKKIVK